jgi:benzoate-CoA ligase family protein
MSELDRVSSKAAFYETASAEIGFELPERYNASSILFDNLMRGRGDHPAVIGPAGSWSYAELCDYASRFGEVLVSLGLRSGERVLLFQDDGPAYAAAFFGAMRAGFVPVLINTLTPSELLQFYLQDSGARIAIVDSAFVPRFDAIACSGNDLEHLIVTDERIPGSCPVTTHAAPSLLKLQTGRLDMADTHRDDMAFWQYSSGSTGRPKGIVHLQHDMIYTAESFGRHVLEIQPDDICLSIPKIFFAYGLGNSLTFPFSAGATTLLLPGQPKPSPIFEAIAQYRPTLFFGLPTLYTALTHAPEAKDADLSSLRLCLSAAEVLSNEVAEQWRKLSGLPIIEGMGSTEVLHIYLSNRPDRYITGSAGRKVPGYEVKLVDLEGRTVAPGEEGILWVRGDSASPGYWNRPAKTAETMRESGWIYTGDRMVCTAEGDFYFKGRADDLVKVSGQWVYPLEVELCLAEHPSVHECAVMAVELPDRRMTIKAIVVLKGGALANMETTLQLQQHVKHCLLPYKYPRIVEYRESLPKTGTGKIDRQQLLATEVKAVS